MKAPDWREATRRAAADMAALCGLEMRHFRYPGREPDPTFDAGALARGCEVVDHFGPLGPGDGPHGGDEALRDRTLAAYAHRGWMARYWALNVAFLSHEAERRVPSPLSGDDATVLGGVPVQQYQVTPLLDGERLIFQIAIGYMPVGLFYPAARLFLVTTDYRLDARGALHALLVQLLHRPLPWAGWIGRARRGGLRRAFLIGDNRPGHFIRESLAYMDGHEAEILAFAGRGGLLVPIADWCALDPFAIFPALAPRERVEVPSAALTERVLAEGWDAHRVYRTATQEGASWLRRRFVAIAREGAGETGDRPAFRVLISIDAERQRFVNQEEVFRHVLSRLGEACRREGRAFEVAWDGWTLPAEPSDRDREVIARIAAAVAGIREGLPVPPDREFRLFDRPAQDKVPVMTRCGLAFVTQGSGAVLPCWLLGRPTVIYQLPRLTKDRSCLDERAAFGVDHRAVEEVPDPAVAGVRFRIALWGIDDAMGRALEGQFLPAKG